MEIKEDYIAWATAKSFYENKPNVNIDWFFDLPTFLYSDIDNISKCDSKIIVINCITESVHSHWAFRQYPRDRHYVIYSGGNWDKTKYDIGITSYDILYYPFFIFEMVDNYFSPRRMEFYIDKHYNFVYPKQYNFVSTTGNVRPERDKIIEQVVKNINYDNFIYRYSGEDFGQPSNQYDVVSVEPGEFDPYTLVLEKYYHSVGRTLPIHMYNQCYFNLCVETDCNWSEHAFFITEKTVKCLITGMPFVSVNHPKFLKGLHDHGFRTYNTMWDESYDDESDYEKRLDKILKLINHLGTIDWNNINQELQDIANHNLRNLTKLDKSANNFFNRLEEVAETLKQGEENGANKTKDVTSGKKT